MVRKPRHGEAPEGKSLRAAAIAVDRAGEHAKHGTEATLEEAWRDLVSGRVRVVEHFECAGRRFVVARRGGGKLRGAALTQRELSVIERRVRGAPLKDIAADVGVSVSTVAKALKRALEKLGLQTQAELIALLGGGCGDRAGKAVAGRTT